MKKFTVTSSILLVLFNSLCAQQTDFNTIVQPIDIKAKDFAEYLVQLAWLNNPESNIAQEEVKQAKTELKLAKKDWMKDFQLTFNLNEANLFPPDALPKFLYNQTGDPILDKNNQKIPLTSQVFDENGNAVPLETAGGSAFYPRYNFGINLNLGNILTQKNKNQVKQHEIKIAEQNVNKAKFEIRAEVLARYQNYRLAKEILKTRTQVEQDTKDNFTLVTENYKKDEATFADVNESSSAYHEAVEARIKAETEVLLAKIRLEEIIGVRWEQVQHPGKEF